MYLSASFQPQASIVSASLHWPREILSLLKLHCVLYPHVAVDDKCAERTANVSLMQPEFFSYFFHNFSEKRAFPLGINILFYLMTH